MSKIIECIGLLSSAIKSGEEWSGLCQKAKEEALNEHSELIRATEYPCMKAFLFLRQCGFEVEGYYNSDHIVGLLGNVLIDDKGRIEDWGYNDAKDEIYLPNQTKFISFSKYGYYNLTRDFKNLSNKEKSIFNKCFEK